MQVIKASGKTEPFSEKKVLQSLKRVGVPEDVAVSALRHVKEQLKDNIKTQEVSQLVTEYLKKNSSPKHYSNYSLRRAIFQLGPTGYPFETFVAEIFRAMGYQAKVSQIYAGKCISHEVDVDLTKDKYHYFVECKFHNQPGYKADVQVALYTHARFSDIATNYPKNKDEILQSWLVTNTKASRDAIKYANCVGLKITTWGYPGKSNLRQMILDARLHPVTCLATLDDDQKKFLVDQNIVTLKTLREDLAQPEKLDEIIPSKIRKMVLDEISQIIE